MKLSHSRIGISTVAGVAIAAVFVVAGVSVAADHKTTIVLDQGLSRSVTGFQRTAGDALSMAGVNIGPHDVVKPATFENVADGQAIEVLRAEKYHADGQSVWSAASTLSGVLADSGAKTLFVDRSREGRPLGEPGEAAQIVINGEPLEKTYEGNKTVSLFVDEAGLELNPIDIVTLTRKDGGLAVEVITQERTIHTSESQLEFEEERVEDPELHEGNEVVIQEGENGVRATKVYRHVRGGEVVVETVLADWVTKEPVNRVIVVGTKKEEPVERPPTEPTGDVWAALAQCESGGNPSANTGNGYYGLYQFSQPTWESVGGSGLPSDASAEEQTMRAQMLQQRSGWGQWGGCSASLGLY